MDRATLTDNTGKKADFRNVILMMTSNVGARELESNVIGFRGGSGDLAGKEAKAIEKMFTPEFRNRLDAVVKFNSLPLDVIKQVVDKFVGEMAVQLAPKGVTITLTDAARTWLAEHGFDAKFGARPLARLIQTEMTNALTDELLFGRLEHGGSVTVDVVEEKLDFQFAN